MRLLDLKKHAKAISLLAIGGTLIGAVLYGTLFYGVSMILGLELSFPVCLMFGSIVAPTDPIAATSILKKFNLPSNIGFIIEGESLLNDGVGVALFVCFSGMVSAQENGGFFAVVAKELFGAVLAVATAYHGQSDEFYSVCLAKKLPDVYYIILGGTYAIVFFTTIVQGMTMPKVYDKIKNSLK